MNRSLRAKLFASAIALSVVPIVGVSFPAIAQEVVSFDTFHDALAGEGDWVYSDRWGEVWVPQNVPDDFRPYFTAGRWVDTDDYGWLWASDYDWGDITFHYGRWVNDPDDGWLWIPGYVWSPGWVIWRSNAHYTGWMPMPPDDNFLRDTGKYGSPDSIGVSIDFNRTDDFYGYARWYGHDYDEIRFASNWVFVGTGNLSDRDYRAHAVSRTNIINIVHTTTNITNYTVVNNFIVNRSVDARAVERAGGHPIHSVQAGTVLRRPLLITRTDTGRATQLRMRQTNPRGTGVANSAPQPSPAIVRTLSVHAVQHNGRPPAHLFTQQTVVHAALRPAGNAATTPPALTPTPGGPAAHNPGSLHGVPPSTAPANGAAGGALPVVPPAGQPPHGRMPLDHMDRHHPSEAPIAPASPTNPDLHGRPPGLPPATGSGGPAAAGPSSGPAGIGTVPPRHERRLPTDHPATDSAGPSGGTGSGVNGATPPIGHHAPRSNVVTGAGTTTTGTLPPETPPPHDHRGRTVNPVSPSTAPEPPPGAAMQHHNQVQPTPNAAPPATPSDHPGKPVKPKKEPDTAPQ